MGMIELMMTLHFAPAQSFSRFYSSFIGAAIFAMILDAVVLTDFRKSRRRFWTSTERHFFHMNVRTLENWFTLLGDWVVGSSVIFHKNSP